MIYFNGTTFTPHTYQATFTDNGEPRTQYGEHRRYWEEMVSRWGHLNSLVVSPLVLSTEQQDRLTLLNSLQEPSDMYTAESILFVEHGVIDSDTTCPWLQPLVADYANTTLTYYQNLLKQRAADARWHKEIAGVSINGMSIVTDDRSKSLLSSKVSRAMIAQQAGDTTWTSQWKTSNGWIDLNAEQIIGIGIHVDSYIQACFDRESEIVQAIENDTFTEDMLETGWPSQTIVT